MSAWSFSGKRRAGISELIPRKQNTVAISLEWEVGPQVFTVLLAAHTYPFLIVQKPRKHGIKMRGVTSLRVLDQDAQSSCPSTETALS